MSKDEKTQQRVEQRLREAAPPIPQDTPSVWPAVQERLYPRQRSHVRPLLWAGTAATMCASICIAWMVGHEPEHASRPYVPLPPPRHVVTKETPALATKYMHHVPHFHKETIAVRPVRPHSSHIAYRRPVEAPPPDQSPPPDQETDTPRLRPASAVPHPVSIKPVE